jgi:type II secretory ATPase GspE/PulE/Tfp pilus assembly ATPase PilB-like protein
MGYYEPVGCQFCDHQGFAARLPIAELLTVGPAVRRAIHRRATSAEIHEAAVGEGMVPLLQSGVELAGKGVTSLAEVLRVAG